MSRDREHKIFTVEEADGLVLELTEIFSAIRAEKTALESLLPDIKIAASHQSMGGGSVYGARYVAALARISDALDRVSDMGVMVKDVDKGLCDFLYDRDGNLIFLCWQLGEDSISWWHNMDEGFGGRRAISELRLET